jgi:hypothetical protein
MLVLLWLGALEIDGKVPGVPNDASTLTRLNQASTPRERSTLGKLDRGDKSNDPGIFAMQKLLTAMHRAWVLDVPLFVDG